MSTLNKGKINLVLQKAVPGTVLTMKWLAEQGVSKDLARKYVASGWLERIGRGAYVRVGAVVDWEGAVYSLQIQLGMSVHVAALSALQLKGLAHYLPLRNENAIQLFSDGAERLPIWFSETNWEVQVEHRGVRLFDSENNSLSDVEHKSFSIRVSSPERAALEMLYCVKSNSDFDFAQEVFAGLGGLRPMEIQALLDGCKSVRVKRTFLWMAKACEHPWLKYVDLQDVDLGSGKRVVYQDGMLDRDFQITVPRRNRKPNI
jgi:hypothetical protein